MNEQQCNDPSVRVCRCRIFKTRKLDILVVMEKNLRENEVFTFKPHNGMFLCIRSGRVLERFRFPTSSLWRKTEEG